MGTRLFILYSIFYILPSIQSRDKGQNDGPVLSFPKRVADCRLVLHRLLRLYPRDKDSAALSLGWNAPGKGERAIGIRPEYFSGCADHHSGV